MRSEFSITRITSCLKFIKQASWYIFGVHRRSKATDEHDIGSFSEFTRYADHGVMPSASKNPSSYSKYTQRKTDFPPNVQSVFQLLNKTWIYGASDKTCLKNSHSWQIWIQN